MKRLILFALLLSACVTSLPASPVKSMIGAVSKECVDYVEEYRPSVADYVQENLLSMWDIEEALKLSPTLSNLKVVPDIVGANDTLIKAYYPGVGIREIGKNYIDLYHAWLECESDGIEDSVVSRNFTVEIVCDLSSMQAMAFFGCGNFNWSIYNVNKTAGYIRVGGALNSKFIDCGDLCTLTWTFGEVNGYYRNGELVSVFSVGNANPSSNLVKIMGRDGGQSLGKFYICRIYDRCLSEDEIEKNREVDIERFGL